MGWASVCFVVFIIAMPFLFSTYIAVVSFAIARELMTN